MMRRRAWLAAPLLPLAGAAGAEPRLSLVWHERAWAGFGTTVSVRAAHADPQRLRAALDATVATLRAVERETSLFAADSALRRLNADGVLERPGPHLLAVLHAARRVAAASDGAFDATLQPLWAAWDDARRRGTRPGAAELREARAHIGWRGVVADAAAVRLVHPGMALTLNGIAQGYAADAARAVLRRHGVAHALIDAGEWASLGRAPDGDAWRLGVEDPRAAAHIVATLRSDGRAVACSSDAHYRFGADDRDHHILDPRSGHSPRAFATVVVVAPSATLADASTKVLFMAPDAAAALAIARRWGFDALLVDKAGRVAASPGLRVGIRPDAAQPSS